MTERATRVSALTVTLGLALQLGAACGPALLVTAPSGPQPGSAQPVSVDFPPPPAKIEEIPLSRRSNNPCSWRDGYWDWTGRRWEWQPGRPVLAPPGCHFAEPKLVWTADSLSFYRPAWYPDADRNPAPKTCIEVSCIPASDAPRAAP